MTRLLAFSLLMGACSFSGRGTEGVVDDAAIDAPPDVMVDARNDDPCVATQLVANAAHTCARRADGVVWCWGNNGHGEIGSASTDLACPSGGCVLLPTMVPLPQGAVSLGLGDQHSCAIDGEGNVSCWGNNSTGQFGDGLISTSTTVRPVAGRAGSTQLIGGENHTCSLVGTAVKCSGLNSHAELGDDSHVARYAPVEPTGLGAVTAIGAGYWHSCAIAGGVVSCWGRNFEGQIDGTSVDITTPQTIAGVADAVAVAAGFGHTCALLGDRTARCWGDNTSTQLGVVGATGLVKPPLEELAQVTAGSDHTCARTLAGAVSCWGESYGAPVAIALGGPATMIASGSYHDCALLADGSVWCWGINPYGQLGDGTRVSTVGHAAVESRLCPP